MAKSLRSLAALHRTETSSADFISALKHFVSVSDTPRGCLELEELPRRDLEASVKEALERGLLQPLKESQAPDATVALYHLAHALPSGPERRRLENHVSDTLYRGPGRTCIGLIAAMVLRERSTSDTQALFSRVSLCLAYDMLGAESQKLALALYAARELHEQWLAMPAEGALPRRLMSARLLVAAARGATIRAQASDRAALSLLSSPAQHAVRQRLLFDREPLVWRLAALARGWLAGCSPHEAARMDVDLSPRLTPTEWRRAGVSLVASAAVAPKGVLRRINAMEGDQLFTKDRGLAAAMLHGLLGSPGGADAHAIGTRLCEIGGFGCVAEVTSVLEREPESELLRTLGEKLLSKYELDLGPENLTARRRARDLNSLSMAMAGIYPEDTVPSAVHTALEAYWKRGPSAAMTDAAHGLELADQALERLRCADLSGPDGEWAALEAVDALQRGILSDGTLTDLLFIGAPTHQIQSAMDYFRQRLLHLLLMWSPAGSVSAHPALPIARAVAVIRVLDMEVDRMQLDLHESSGLGAIQVLLSKLHDPSNASLRRPLCAAIARAADALVRRGIWEASDVLLLAGLELPDVECCKIMAEASMAPGIAQSLHALATCLSPEMGQSSRVSVPLERLLQGLPPVAGPRVESFRSAFSTLTDGLWEAPSQSRGFVAIAKSLGELEWLVRGFSVRLTGESAKAAEDWDLAIGAPQPREATVVAEALERTLLGSFKGPLGAWLVRVVLAATSVPSTSAPTSSVGRRTERLPDWLPATREMGSYIILRSVGGGAGGSVFLSRRRDQQLQHTAPTFALKVPDMGQGATRLSRDRFLEMFCAEAGALASLPAHTNLASLDSFDRSAFPMPFLVMEYVDGPSLDAEICSGNLSFDRALDALIGVTRGLTVMHTHGIGHLDLKPSNVILSDRHGREEAVLVDFGLAGRHVREACGTPAYAAPEVFGDKPEQADPRAADIYSLAVLAFEILVGQPLFKGPTDIAYLTQHLSHDGDPELLQVLKDRGLAQAATLLSMMLRQSPEARCNIHTVMNELVELSASLETVRPVYASGVERRDSPIQVRH